MLILIFHPLKIVAQVAQLRIFAQFAQLRKIENIARTAQIRTIAQLAQQTLEGKILICAQLRNRAK